MVEVARPSGTGEDDVEPSAGDAHCTGAGRTGRVRIGSLLLAALLFGAGYLGVQALFAYVNYLSLADFVRLVVRDVAIAPKQAEEAPARILAKARELDLPVQERHVMVTADVDKVQVNVQWRHPIGFGKYGFFLTFEIAEGQRLR